MKYLIILLLLASCVYKPKFTDGMYVKHIQSECVGVVMMTYRHGLNKGKVVLEDYICEIEHKKFKYTKKIMFDTNENNLKYAGFKTVKKYNQAMVRFIIKEK